MSLNTIIKKVAELGFHPNDDEDIKVSKSTLTLLSLPFAIIGLSWGIIYFFNGLIIPGYIPFFYGLLSLGSFIHFSIVKNYKIYRNIQLFFILILPFLLQLSLGGFIYGSVVILFSLLSPFCALVFFNNNSKKAIPWFAAYLILVIVAYVLNDHLINYFDWDISDSFINFFFILNIVCISVCMYSIQYYSVSQQMKLKSSVKTQKKELEVQSEKLKELDQMKSHFFANISHEFRTPLTLIIGLLNKQLTNIEKPPSKTDCNAMIRNSNRLLQLVNQLLDLSKLESGALKLTISEIDLVIYTKQITQLFIALANGKSLTITFNERPLSNVFINESIYAFIDQEKMQMVLTNLISNAIKFTPEHGTIEIEVLVVDDKARIVISNSGKGIPSASLPYIFNRFYQVDDESTRQFDGSGIGLALVKELVELHHGQIRAESDAQHTTFTVDLPLNQSLFKDAEIVDSIEHSIDKDYATTIAIDAETNQTTKIIKHKAPLDSENKLEVLVVEDNPDIRDYISGILEQDYIIYTAVDGEEGLEKANATIPDLIISDVMMPKMDGYELCNALKTNELTNHIPVIILTAKASKDSKLEGLEHGADAYLTKPFDEKELLIRIKNLIAIRTQLQQKYQRDLHLKPKQVKVTSAHQKFLKSLKEAIEANIDNDQFGVEGLGTEIGMSRSQVHRKLKALTDQSATQFIRNYRLHRAADLLNQESGNVTEIAYQVGFSSQTYFSKCFQELFGTSPSEYKSSN